jgi:hypothetical protein
MGKVGLNTSNLKTEGELSARFLQFRQSEKITLPNELDEDNRWRLIKLLQRNWTKSRG